MSLDELQQAARGRVAGSKQVLKAARRGAAGKVWLASDADHSITAPIVQACEAGGIPVEWVETMDILGSACGLDVGTAAAARVRDDRQ